MFTDMTPRERLKLLFDKGLCYQCLSLALHQTAVSIELPHVLASLCRHKAHSRYHKKNMYYCEDHKHDAECKFI